jgi:hypothetical protein
VAAEIRFSRSAAVQIWDHVSVEEIGVEKDKVFSDILVCQNAGHNNVTCKDYGCYAQWSATTVAFL